MSLVPISRALVWHTDCSDSSDTIVLSLWQDGSSLASTSVIDVNTWLGMGILGRTM